VIDEADHALLERYRGGDAAAFRDLVVRYQRPVYNAAFWILRNADDARDVAQTVFLRVAERADDYDPKHKLFSWIYRIAVNEALNLLRRNGREEALDEDVDYPGDDRADPQRQLEDGERTRLVRTALMKMNVSDRTVITLRHFSELTYREIGDALGIEEKTVKSRLFEARQRMRALLPDLGKS
jgi:RNA polymerase sigma-70 factor, ECF subfamily